MAVAVLHNMLRYSGTSIQQTFITRSPRHYMNDFLQPGQNYTKTYGTEPRLNEILVITSRIHQRKRNVYLDITNKCQHVIKDECQRHQQG